MSCRRVVFASAIALLCASLARATIFGNIRGMVHGPDHRPVPEAEVTLEASSSQWSSKMHSGSEGDFSFPAVPVGEYRLRVERSGFQTAEKQIVVASGSAPVFHIMLELAASRQTVEVTGTPDLVDTQSATPSVFVTRQQIERAPGGDRTNSMAMITNYVPGAYMTHNQLHIRGGHQATWAVDGVPVPNTNIASNAGPQFDPKDIDSMEVLRGSYSAEYGDRTYGVFNVVPRTGFERDREAELVTSYGSFHQTNSQFSLGSHTQKFAYYGSFNGNRTDLGLSTPGPELLHDQANGFGGFGSLVYNATASDQLRWVTSLRQDYYQIPNDPDQQAAGIRDVERENDAFLNFSWLHTFSSRLLVTVSPFYHYNRANYIGGPADVPVSPRDDHASHYAGAQISASLVTGKHNAKAGVFGFAQKDSTLFALRANDGSGLSLQQQENLSGHLEAVFVEDQYRMFPWLTLTGGVRLTHFNGVLSENAASPRIGAAIRIPRLNWVIRGFYGRYYQAPPLATVSGTLLDVAQQQGFGFLPLHGERDEERQFGITIPVRGWSLDIDYYLTRARNLFDHEALGNSNIFFPLTIEGGRIRGWDVALRSPRLFKRAGAHLAYSNLLAEGFGGISGGLTDFEPPPEGLFLLDHDQHHTLNTGFDANLPWRAWVSANVYYGSGFPDEGGPARLPSHVTTDLMLGKSFGERWSLSVNALNAGNRRFLLDNSPTFGGTHYSDPRQIFGQLRFRFHY